MPYRTSIRQCYLHEGAEGQCVSNHLRDRGCAALRVLSAFLILAIWVFRTWFWTHNSSHVGSLTEVYCPRALAFTIINIHLRALSTYCLVQKDPECHREAILTSKGSCAQAISTQATLSPPVFLHHHIARVASELHTFILFAWKTF